MLIEPLSLHVWNEVDERWRRPPQFGDAGNLAQRANTASLGKKKPASILFAPKRGAALDLALDRENNWILSR